MNLATGRPHKRLLAVLSSGLLALGCATASADALLFRLNDLDYSADNLPVSVQQAIHEQDVQHYRKLRELVDGAAITVYIEDEANRLGRSKEAVTAELLGAPAPSEAEIQQFYTKNKKRISYPLDQIKGEIARVLQNQVVQKKAAALLASLEKKGVYRRLLMPPTAPLVELTTEGFPSKGTLDAKVTIVDFSDFQCPHCKHAADALRKLMEQYGDRVKLVYKDLPVNPSKISQKIAEGAVCAQEQGKFWPYHDLAFAHQSSLKNDSPTKFARELGLDVDIFGTCMDSERPQRRVAASAAEAASLGVHSTPTLFVNGRRLHLFELERDIKDAIEQALKRAAS